MSAIDHTTFLSRNSRNLSYRTWLRSLEPSAFVNERNIAYKIRRGGFTAVFASNVWKRSVRRNYRCNMSNRDLNFSPDYSIQHVVVAITREHRGCTRSRLGASAPC